MVMGILKRVIISLSIVPTVRSLLLTLAALDELTSWSDRL